MRYSIKPILTCIAAFALTASFAQQTEKKYEFKEVGWTLMLPSEFVVIDSASNATIMKRGIQAIEDVNNVNADISQTRTLISANKNKYNYFNSTITPFDPQKEGSLAEANQKVKEMAFKTFLEKIPDAKLDSVSTTESIDGLLFDKFRITVTIGDHKLFTMFLMTRFYRGYDFGISYLYLDDKTKEQMESMLRNSKFDK